MSVDRLTLIARFVSLAGDLDLVAGEYYGSLNYIENMRLGIDAVGEVRSKCRTIQKGKESLDQLPNWNYDGSSTDQAPGEDSEVIVSTASICWMAISSASVTSCSTSSAVAPG